MLNMIDSQCKTATPEDPSLIILSQNYVSQNIISEAETEQQTIRKMISQTDNILFYPESCYVVDQQLPFYEPETLKLDNILNDFHSYYNESDNVVEAIPQTTSTLQNFLSPSPIYTSNTWHLKPIEHWHPTDVIEWLFDWATHHRIDSLDVNMSAFSKFCGESLSRMSRNEFRELDVQHGDSIFEAVQQLIGNHDKISFDCSEFLPLVLQDQDFFNDIDWSNEKLTPQYDLVELEVPENVNYGPVDSHGCGDISPRSDLSNCNEESFATTVSFDNENIVDDQDVSSRNKKQGTGRRGRPPKKDAKCRNRQGKGLGKLWEFIRDLLLNPNYNPAYIRWERREEGIFKFVQSEKVAKLWGDRKQNTKMTYEKLSRAMRYYYKSQVLLPVFGRRLVYKFGPNATGWRLHEADLSY
ncbi:ETS homologous factor-like [Tachypleus tridentatus]|uniref:ETS homologous factor-like n=1 Tax=Tachypleus tridentatus TaxID=6853 RepID=UPI003FCEFFE2